MRNTMTPFDAGRLPRIGSMRGATSSDAAMLIGNEWAGFALDFLGNTYAIRQTVAAEALLGTGPGSADAGLGIDFTDNSYALGT